MCVNKKSTVEKKMAKYRIAVGGAFGDELLDKVEIYDVASQKWNQVKDNHNSQLFYQKAKEEMSNTKGVLNV